MLLSYSLGLCRHQKDYILVYVEIFHSLLVSHRDSDRSSILASI